MADTGITIDSNAAVVAVRYAGASKLVAASVVKVFRHIGAEVVRYVARHKLSGQTLDARTGTLRRALFFRTFQDVGSRDAGVVVGADAKKAPHARVHEYGGTIVPKRSRFLTIPVGKALTGKGVARVSAREFIQNPQSLGFERAFVNPGKTAIMGSRGDDAEPVFALKDRVVLPERSYLRAGVNERRAWILDQLGASVQDGVNSGLNS